MTIEFISTLKFNINNRLQALKNYFIKFIKFLGITTVSSFIALCIGIITTQAKIPSKYVHRCWYTSFVILLYYIHKLTSESKHNYIFYTCNAIFISPLWLTMLGDHAVMLLK